MRNFEKAVEAIGIAGIVEMMAVYCEESTASTRNACQWRKALAAIPGCQCFTAHDIVKFLESEQEEDADNV